MPISALLKALKELSVDDIAHTEVYLRIKDPSKKTTFLEIQRELPPQIRELIEGITSIRRYYVSKIETEALSNSEHVIDINANSLMALYKLDLPNNVSDLPIQFIVKLEYINKFIQKVIDIVEAFIDNPDRLCREFLGAGQLLHQSIVEKRKDLLGINQEIKQKETDADRAINQLNFDKGDQILEETVNFIGTQQAGLQSLKDIQTYTYKSSVSEKQVKYQDEEDKLQKVIADIKTRLTELESNKKSFQDKIDHIKLKQGQIVGYELFGGDIENVADKNRDIFREIENTKKLVTTLPSLEENLNACKDAIEAKNNELQAQVDLQQKLTQQRKEDVQKDTEEQKVLQENLHTLDTILAQFKTFHHQLLVKRALVAEKNKPKMTKIQADLLAKMKEITEAEDKEYLDCNAVFQKQLSEKLLQLGVHDAPVAVTKKEEVKPATTMLDDFFRMFKNVKVAEVLNKIPSSKIGFTQKTTDQQ